MGAFLRFLAGAFLLIAVVFAVNDATEALAGRGTGQVTVHQAWSTVSPASLKNAQRAVDAYSHPTLWQWTVFPLLQLPAWLLFGLLGLGLAYAGRRRRQVNIYAN